MTYQPLSTHKPQRTTISSIEASRVLSETLKVNEQQEINCGVKIGDLIWLPENNELQVVVHPSVFFLLPVNMQQFMPHDIQAVTTSIKMTNVINNLSDKTNIATIPQSGIYFYEAISQFFVDGRAIIQTDLTEQEYDLLLYLYKNAGRVCSYRRIEKNVWHGYAEDNTICRGICKLRQKLNKVSSGAGTTYIKTSRGHTRGYMLINTKQ